MSPVDTLTLLLITEHAEEIKQTTISMRRFYPGCRAEAVYSAEEALEWVTKQDWGVILLDEQMSMLSGLPLLPELRKLAPRSAIIVQGAERDPQAAAELLRAGADYCLSKQSPMFLTELPIVAKQVLENRHLSVELESTRERHRRLIEAIPDLAYELDADGRFLAIGSNVRALLGYTQEELIGVHCSMLLRQADRQRVLRHVHERRTGPRAAAGKTITFVGKQGGTVKVICYAFGMYDQHQQYLGTVGFIKGHQEANLKTGTPLRSFEPQAPESSVEPPQPPVSAIPTTGEPAFIFHERRQAQRTPVQIEASLSLNGSTVFRGDVRDISLIGLYIVVQGYPDIKEDQSVQLSFDIEGAILNIPAKIQHVRRVTSPQNHEHRTPGLGLGVVIVYSELGAIEGPVLASLLQELLVRPRCATLAIHPAPRNG